MATVTLFQLVADRLAGMSHTPIYYHDEPEGDWQYAILNPWGGTPQSTGLDDRYDQLDMPFQVMCVGHSRAGALDVLDQVRAKLVGWDPLPGSVSSGCVYEDPTYAPIIPQGVEGDMRYSVTPTYRLTTDRT